MDKSFITSGPGPKVIKLISYSTQLSMYCSQKTKIPKIVYVLALEHSDVSFILLVNVKKIVGL